MLKVNRVEMKYMADTTTAATKPAAAKPAKAAAGDETEWHEF